MSFEQAHNRNDMKELTFVVLKYCSNKLGYRLDKLRENITNEGGKINEVYIEPFLDYAKTRIDVDDMYGKKPAISRVCYNYYQTVKKDSAILKKFLKHIKKKWDLILELQLLNPDTADQTTFSWNNIVKIFLPVREEYNDFKKRCMKDRAIRESLERIYGGDKEKKFIAISKRCCYLCESYIRFVNFKGYKITVSESHKKLYHRWKLPNTFKQEFMEDIVFDFDGIIESEIKYHIHINSDSDPESGDSDIDRNFSTTLSYADDLLV
ncbi:9868_t:CDS:2 [Funneliformis geosporum]|uniref:9868_t:CDS:1 n=1 Tax=Funneliformis geosporum TaxID=1117311 RepID=A0A9W4SS31_9GLOM|nr:9868_t:CDS:2 [Funneliformis geosporum]